MRDRSNLWRVGGLAAILTAVLSVLACTVESRYRTLSFFFDGVPAPQERTNASTPPPVVADARRLAAPMRHPVHRDLEETQCRICHDITRGFEPATEVSMVSCDRCHAEQRLTEGWNHGPVNLGQCLPCHTSGHDSGNPHLLSQPVEELCFYCHDQQEAEENPFHGISAWLRDAADCFICHNPHRL